MFKTLTAAAALALAALPAGAAAPERYTADEAHAELTALYEGLRSAHYDLFESTPQTAYDRHYHELMREFHRPVTKGELYAELARFAALAGHAHTRINSAHPGWSAYYGENGGLAFPLALSIFEGEVIVDRAPASGPVRPGDRIVSVDGQPNPIWLARLTRTIAAETPDLAYSLLSGSEAYYFWLEYGPRDHFTVEVSRNGRVREIEISAISREGRMAMTGAETGFALEGRAADMVEAGIAYLRPGPFYNINATSQAEAYDPAALVRYTDFIDDSFETFMEAGAHTLILDLRDNPGGDNSFSDPVISWFADQPFRFASDFRMRVSAQTTASNQARVDAQPEGEGGVSVVLAELFASVDPGETVSFELPYAQPRAGERFDGDVIALVNRRSYSNAVSAAALIQDYGFGLIIGEPTRDMATSYGAMETFELPNTGWTVGYPKAHIIRPSGREDLHPVTPDVVVDIPAVRGSQDVALDAAIERARR